MNVLVGMRTGVVGAMCRWPQGNLMTRTGEALGLWQDFGQLAKWAGAARWAGRSGRSAAAVAAAPRAKCRD